MNKWIFCIVLLIIFSCKSKKRNSTESYFSALAYLQGQVKQMDTAKFNYTKIEIADTTSDTSRISHQDFRRYANDFLTMPDISDDDNYEDYEESNTYDEELNNVLLTYTTKDEDAEIRRQTIMLEPNDFGDSKVKTILVNRIMTGKDSTVEKEMTWHVNRRFQVVTKTTTLNQPEKIRTVIVYWE